MEQKSTKKVLSVKYNYNMPTEEFKKITSSVAPHFSEIPGLCWKIWLLNEDRKEAGGVYLFESAPEMEQFLNSKLFAALGNNPAITNVHTNTFGVAEALSVITGAPLINMVNL
jgi:Putative mono-oxygenase ydhR